MVLPSFRRYVKVFLSIFVYIVGLFYTTWQIPGFDIDETGICQYNIPVNTFNWYDLYLQHLEYYDLKRGRQNMKRAKACDELVLDIKRTILSGKYPPGSQLPSERELAAKYNLSRVPVREAINQLVQENILRTEPHVGTFVTDLCNAELLSKDMYQTSHIEKKILKESLITRQLIEGECAALAAEHATEDDIKDIQEKLFSSTNEFRKLKQMKQNTFFQEDYAFHLAIARASHSEIYLAYLSNLAETIAIHQFCSTQMENSLNVVPDSHFRIYNAILSKNPQMAREEMVDHLQRTADLIL